MHEIDLKNSFIRTDLAVELIDGTSKKIDNIKITNITLDEKEALKINKKKGNYTTIEFEDVTDNTNKEKVTHIFTEELKKMMNLCHIKDNDLGLIIGLGNEKSTPDSLGPLVISKTLVTNYLPDLEEGFRKICAISPGVMGETGIETSDLIKSIVNTIKPNFVLVIDALAAYNIDKVNKTIQMTDAGINPGSGVGNKRKEISKEILKIPTIAIGVPTVVDAASIVSDTINFLYDKYAYEVNKINDPSSKLTFNVNYLKLNKYKINKEKLFGMIGSLSKEDTKSLMYEVLNPIGYNLMVTPKEEDFVIEKLSLVLSDGINKAMHKNM